MRERLKFELLHVLMIFVLLFSIREERAGGSKHVMRNLNPFTASGECSLVRFIVSIALDCKKHTAVFPSGSHSVYAVLYTIMVSSIQEPRPSPPIGLS